MVLALSLVAVIAATLLALADRYTRQPIAEAQRQALRLGLNQVLPAHANSPEEDTLDIAASGGTVRCYRARDTSGRITGIAFEMVAADGYAGSIRILIGVEPSGRIYAIRVTDHRETPGLGDGIASDQGWLDAFVGRALAGTHWAVKKDGGDFDQFTGATISPRAVVASVRRGLEFYAAHEPRLLDAAGQKPKPASP